MRASHFQQAVECHRCRCSNRQTIHKDVPAMAIQPTDALHSRESNPNSEIRPI